MYQPPYLNRSEACPSERHRRPGGVWESNPLAPALPHRLCLSRTALTTGDSTYVGVRVVANFLSPVINALLCVKNYLFLRILHAIAQATPTTVNAKLIFTIAISDIFVFYVKELLSLVFPTSDSASILSNIQVMQPH